MTASVTRCAWAATPLGIAYHDAEWGVPVHDDRTLFEFLVLEGAQAGLSWETILKKRDRYREVLDGFNFERVARYTPARMGKLLQDPGIVRNRLKIESTVRNARALMAVRDEMGSFDAYIWRFVDGEPIVGRFRRQSDVPAKTAVSDAMSSELRRRGFNFVGSTICYAFMQAVGLANDHLVGCYRQAEVGRAAAKRRALRARR
ncbi:MAG TPA: DNA-3-methyladenine glycosylase I [Gemmatimonadaceae bacterium]|nr:DNA-3-methyladenine glycosylase I [Gemmatimonadaceae bacterium]